MSTVRDFGRKPVFWCVCLVLAGFAALWASRPEAASLQDLVDRNMGSKQPTEVQVHAAGPVAGASGDYTMVGFKIGSAMYRNDFNSDAWRRECFSYQGMGSLELSAPGQKFLDFPYGRDDMIVFCFTAPEVAYGGTLAVTSVLGPGPVEVSVSSRDADFMRVGRVSGEGRLVVNLPPAAGTELYVMLDGRRGNGLVIDDLEVNFNSQAMQPTPTPTPVPQVKDDRPGYERAQSGATTGARVEPGSDRSSQTEGNVQRVDIKRAGQD